MKTYCTTKAVLQDADGNVLVLKRSSTHPTQGGHWDLPGGIIDPGEQPANTLCREIAEETGMEVVEDDLKLAFAMSEENEGENAVRLMYVVRIGTSQPTMKLSWEHDEYKWVALQDAIKLMHEGRYKKTALQYLADNNIVADL